MTATAPLSAPAVPWEESGLCRRDPSPWIDPPGAAAASEAALACREHCPVLAQCCEYAARHHWSGVVVAGKYVTQNTARAARRGGARPTV